MVLVVLPLLLAALTNSPQSESAVEAADSVVSAAFLDRWCAECHSGSKPKGKFALDDSIDRLASAKGTDADWSILRKALRRITDEQMPPLDHDLLPTAAERAAGMDALRKYLMAHRPSTIVKSAPPRRLNRAEYANSIRDLFEMNIEPLGSLPPDDVGAGFDNIGSVLSLAPTSLERYLELAEAIAANASPDPQDTGPFAAKIEGSSMLITPGKGTARKHDAFLYAQGDARTTVKIPRAGRYAVTVQVAGYQAGPDPVHMTLSVGEVRIASFDVTETSDAPGIRRVEMPLMQGPQTIAVSFVNDFFQPATATTATRDRNASVLGITVEGPLEPYKPPAWRRAMDAAIGKKSGGAAIDAGANWLISRLLRRDATANDRTMLKKVVKSLGPSPSFESQMRAMITALLVHPEFLFRIEKSPPAGMTAEITPRELATRLSFFLWASCPDENLSAAAARGELATAQGRAKVVDAMLADQRSASLGERFATQWLAIDAMTQKTPDPKQFPGVDAALLSSMRQETVRFFDSVLREGSPAVTLIDADYTFVDARLAKHYGMTPPATDAMTRVPTDPSRGGGVLTHASVLTATSNPTRTSPVKRGKWVLESLLDAAPPPPPPGTAQIPDSAEGRAGRSMRELLEIHRADTSCASCHLRMDAIGLAFEGYDPVGRPRDRVDDKPVDARGELPDGSVLLGLAGVRANLLKNPAFIRSLVKHLMTYATGCEVTESAEAEIDWIVWNISAKPTISDIVHAIVESPSFRMRGAS